MKFLDFVCINFIIISNLSYIEGLTKFRETGGNESFHQFWFILLMILIIGFFRLCQIHYEAKAFCFSLSDEDKKKAIDQVHAELKLSEEDKKLIIERLNAK
jgi:hypothetical protein